MRATEQILSTAETEVVAKATRRRFTAEYKRAIVREADAGMANRQQTSETDATRQ